MDNDSNRHFTKNTGNANKAKNILNIMVIIRMQIKIIMQYLYTSIKMSKGKRVDQVKC